MEYKKIARMIELNELIKEQEKVFKDKMMPLKEELLVLKNEFKENKVGPDKATFNMMYYGWQLKVKYQISRYFDRKSFIESHPDLYEKFREARGTAYLYISKPKS